MEDILISIIDNIKFIVMPQYWIMNFTYSKVWDTKLNTLLKEHKFTEITGYTVKLDNELIWIANHPYASFTSEPEYKCHGRPSRKTIYKAKRLLELDLAEQLIKDM